MEDSFIPLSGIGVVEVNIRELEKNAIEVFQKCPKYMTIVRHADRADPSDLHCFLMDYVGPRKPEEKSLQKDFVVPRQEVIMVNDSVYGLFSVIRVSEKEGGPEFALVSSVHSRPGFLISIDYLPIDFFSEKEEMV